MDSQETNINPELPPNDQWVYVKDIDPNSAFGRDFESLMAMKPSAVEGEIKSSYLGGRAYGMRFMISNGNNVIVEIEYSDESGDKGYGNATSKISTASGYSYYSF